MIFTYLLCRQEKKGDWDNFKFNCAPVPLFGNSFNLIKMVMIGFDIIIILSIFFYIKSGVDEEIIKCGVNYSNCNYTAINGMV